MKSLVESLVATAGACMLVCGCGRMPSPASPDLGGPNGLITWSSSASKRDPLPGIEQGSVYHLGTVFVVWSDATGGGGGTSSSNVQGVKCQGSLVGKDGRRVEFNCESKDGTTGQVTVDGRPYNLADGNLFLVFTAGDRAQVKQLKTSLSDLKFERESLEAFARNDQDIVEFFTKSAKPKQDA
jgi:hypothetical protein